MADRRQLHEIARELRRWLEWQGGDDAMGAIPASDEKREALRERIRRRRAARKERIQESLKAGPAGQPESPSEVPDEESTSDEEAVWRDLGSRRRGGRTSAQASASDPSDQQEDATSKEEETPKTNAEKLEWLREYLGDCRRCPLWKNRRNIVFGEGDPEAPLAFVGEAPGAREDRTGRPFVGPAGELLNEMIRAMGLERGDVYICNVLKSRPPDNRDPRPEEIRECFPFLQKQLEIIEPDAIVTLGRPATQNLLDSDRPLGALRGRWHEWNGIPLMPTYHPAYLLRSPDQKRKTWNDLQHVMERLGLKEA